MLISLIAIFRKLLTYFGLQFCIIEINNPITILTKFK